MRRIFTEQINGDSHSIEGDDHKHLSIVLRAKVGQAVQLCAGDGFVYDGIISSITKNATTISITGRTADKTEPTIRCDLFMGIVKGGYMDNAIQKATELGVSSIYPMLTDSCVKTDLNVPRASRIAQEAAKQCGRGRVPDVLNPIKLSEIYDRLKDYDLVVFPYENASADIKTVLTDRAADFAGAAKNGNEPARIAVIIGAEGGFSKTEADKLSQITTPVLLGSRILRSDTAAITTLAIIMYHFGQLAVSG